MMRLEKEFIKLSYDKISSIRTNELIKVIKWYFELCLEKGFDNEKSITGLEQVLENNLYPTLDSVTQILKVLVESGFKGVEEKE